jgi:hypothetical protein
MNEQEPRYETNEGMKGLTSLEQAVNELLRIGSFFDWGRIFRSSSVESDQPSPIDQPDAGQ